MKDVLAGFFALALVTILAGSATAQSGSSSTPTGKDAETKDAAKEGASLPDSSSAGARQGSAQVTAIQEALKSEGHDPGDIDGLMGPKTRRALQDFQTAKGITPSGRTDAETLTALGVEAKGAGGSSQK